MKGKDSFQLAWLETGGVYRIPKWYHDETFTVYADSTLKWNRTYPNLPADSVVLCLDSIPVKLDTNHYIDTTFGCCPFLTMEGKQVWLFVGCFEHYYRGHLAMPGNQFERID